MVKKVAGIGKVVEGINSVISAIDSGRVEKIIYLDTGNGGSSRLEKLINIANSKGLAVEKVNTKESWVYNSRHSVVALCIPKKTYNESSLEKLKLDNIVVLDHIQDINNFGAITRSAAAFDFNIVCIPKKRSVNITERTFAVSSGGLENVNIVFYNSIFSLIKKLKSLDYWTIGLEMDTEEDISNVNFNDQKVALFIGSEESGLSNEIQKKLDIVSKINMNNKMESLNASVAAGIAMNHFFKKSS
tara:strand:+ start:830 stop:1564 length:735 start_codon:yes stop_codon:yes gene_type:complete